MNNWWQLLIGFFQKYNTQGVADAVQRLSWQGVIGHRWISLLGAGLLVYLLWTRRFRFLLLLASVVVFVYLLTGTLPGPGAAIPLNKILSFIGGCVLLVVVNLYFWMVRER